MDNQQNILGFIQRTGPVIPAQIAKHLGTNILMASAMLSELTSNKKVNISRVKVGNSPLYYLTGQESSLQNFSDNLNGKEKEAYELLRKERVLRDNELPPAIRVAMASIRDYAKPLVVKTPEGEERFWKWYLIENNEAGDLIRPLFNVPKKPDIEKESKEETKSSQETKKEEPKEEKQVEFIQKKETEKPAPSKDDSFYSKLKQFFDRNGIEILKSEVLRKNSDFDLILSIPSAVGKLNYYCKAKNKKRANDGDLASAYVQGEIKKLPVLFLTTGDITKKAKEMLNQEFKNISVKKI